MSVANGKTALVVIDAQRAFVDPEGYCVVASAVSTFEMVRARGVRVTVVEALTGIRASSQVPGPSGLSRVESTRRTLQAVGVEVVTEPIGD